MNVASAPPPRFGVPQSRAPPVGRSERLCIVMDAWLTPRKDSDGAEATVVGERPMTKLLSKPVAAGALPPVAVQPTCAGGGGGGDGGGGDPGGGIGEPGAGGATGGAGVPGGATGVPGAGGVLGTGSVLSLPSTVGGGGTCSRCRRTSAPAPTATVVATSVAAIARKIAPRPVCSHYARAAAAVLATTNVACMLDGWSVQKS
jgi:hypothetical protein